MQTQRPHKEYYDPFAHYIRGVLSFDNDTYSFVAYRMPYAELNEKTWESEQAFNADYHRLIEKKYSIQS
jgi:hypothetical protein